MVAGGSGSGSWLEGDCLAGELFELADKGALAALGVDAGFVIAGAEVVVAGGWIVELQRRQPSGRRNPRPACAPVACYREAHNSPGPGRPAGATGCSATWPGWAGSSAWASFRPGASRSHGAPAWTIRPPVAILLVGAGNHEKGGESGFWLTGEYGADALRGAWNYVGIYSPAGAIPAVASPLALLRHIG